MTHSKITANKNLAYADDSQKAFKLVYYFYDFITILFSTIFSN